MLCPVCNKPVEDAEAVPREYPDYRFPSGMVKRIKWVHPACLTTPTPEPRPTGRAA